MREVKKWKWIENIVSVDLPMANESKVNAQKLTSVPSQKFSVANLVEHFLCETSVEIVVNLEMAWVNKFTEKNLGDHQLANR